MSSVSHYASLLSISPYLRDDASAIIGEVIRPPELLMWAGNSGQFAGGFGYLLITSHRFIRALFHAEIDLGSDLLGFFSFGILGSFGKPERPFLQVETRPDFVVAPLTSPLTAHERRSRRTEEYPLSNLSAVQRKDHPLRKHPDRYLVELKLKFQPEEWVRVVFYETQHAQEVYRLLQAPPQPPKEATGEAPAIADQLEKLAELYRYQTITQEEYEAAKRRLLGST